MRDALLNQSGRHGRSAGWPSSPPPPAAQLSRPLTRSIVAAHRQGGHRAGQGPAAPLQHRTPMPHHAHRQQGPGNQMQVVGQVVQFTPPQPLFIHALATADRQGESEQRRGIGGMAQAEAAHADGVLAGADGVLLLAGGAALVLDCIEGQLVLMAGGKEQRLELPISRHAELAAGLPVALLGLAHGAGASRWSGVLDLVRVQEDVEIRMGGVMLRTSGQVVWQWAAEVLSALVRRAATTRETISDLEASYQASPDLVEAP
jgi:hypothetical protein